MTISSGLWAQQPLDRNIDFSASSERLSDILNRLSESENLNFSYNPANESFNRIITYNAVSKPIRTVIGDILSKSGHDFRLVGGQIVVYAVSETAAVQTPPDPTTLVPDQEVSAEPQSETRQEIVMRDTLLLRDTLFLRDTILRVDTLIIRDTIIIKEEPKQVRPEHPKPLRDGLFRMEPDRNNSWYITGFYKQMWSSNLLSASNGEGELLSLVEDSEKNSLSSFSAGAEITRSFNRYQFTSGIQYTRFSNPFFYSHEVVEGGFFVNDTIESYYIVNQSDTTWFYLTDSTWIPRDSRTFNFDRTNRVAYFEIPLMAGFNLISSQHLNVYIKGGIYCAVLLHKNGNAILDRSGYPGAGFSEMDFNTFIFSYALGGGVRYRIFDWIDLNAEAVYRQQLNPVYKNYPINKRISAAGIRAGIIYYF